MLDRPIRLFDYKRPNLNLNDTQQLMRDKATWHQFIKAASTVLSKDER